MNGRTIIPIAIAALLIVALAPVAGAGGAQVTSGEFAKLSGGHGLLDARVSLEEAQGDPPGVRRLPRRGRGAGDGRGLTEGRGVARDGQAP